MTPVTITKEDSTRGQARFVAVTHHGATRSEGRTAGEALDAITDQLPEEERDFVFVVQQQTRPDAFFNEVQIARLRDLTDRANKGETLSDEESRERFALIAEEITASAKRSAAIFSTLQKGQDRWETRSSEFGRVNGADEKTPRVLGHLRYQKPVQ